MKYSLSPKKLVANVRKAKERFKIIAAMSDGDFEAAFAQRNIELVSPPQVKPTEKASLDESTKIPSFIPLHACVQSADRKEQAHKLALSWWDSPGADGTSGLNKIEELIQSISMEKPTARTAILTDHAEYLELPKDAAVLDELVIIAKANGLGAERSDDEQFFIMWGQGEDGKEIGSI